jgi:hypothetical protein
MRVHETETLRRTSVDGKSRRKSSSSRRSPKPRIVAARTGQSIHPKPRTCSCPAYAWPHRPGGGLCRWPDPPIRRCPTPAGTNRRGIARARKGRRWMFKCWGLNPIADRDEFVRLYPVLRGYRVYDLAAARELYRRLKRRGERLVAEAEPGSWQWLERDARGRWIVTRRRWRPPDGAR